MDEEIIGTIAVIAIILSIFSLAGFTYLEMNQPDDNSLEIESDINNLYEIVNNQFSILTLADVGFQSKIVLAELNCDTKISELENQISELDIECDCDIDEDDLEDLEEYIDDNEDDIKDIIDCIKYNNDTEFRECVVDL